MEVSKQLVKLVKLAYVLIGLGRRGKRRQFAANGVIISLSVRRRQPSFALFLSLSFAPPRRLFFCIRRPQSSLSGTIRYFESIVDGATRFTRALSLSQWLPCFTVAGLPTAQ